MFVFAGIYRSLRTMGKLWFIDDFSYVTCLLTVDYEKIIAEETKIKGLQALCSQPFGLTFSPGQRPNPCEF